MTHGYRLAFMCAGCLAIRPTSARCAHNKPREHMWIDPALPGQTQECRRHHHTHSPPQATQPAPNANPRAARRNPHPHHKTMSGRPE